ncbi:MAG TPA: glycosyltransferase family 4 protein [Bryobacterales bacterium]|nr:glycosyltransferase family 4 protein [Bryobacterales bacterium]
MKILVLASWFRAGAGGAFVHLSEIYKRLPHEIVILGDRQPGDEAADARLPWRVLRVSTGVRRSLWKLHTAFSLWRGYGEVERIVAAEKPDLIHAGHYLPWGIYAARLRRRHGIPYALFTWGEDVLAAEHDWLRRRAMTAAAQGARWLFTNSDFTTTHLRNFVARETPIHTIFGSADLARFRPDLPGDVVRKRLGLEDRLILLSVGALRAQQGVDQLLGSVARLAAQFPKLHYLIVGKGGYEEALRQRATELGIASRVTFTGYVPDEELPLYYAACDVFALLHRRVEETGEEMCFGLVFLEAGACGKPVVGSRLGGTHFAIRDGETGFLVEPNSDTAADERLAALLADAGLRARLGMQARCWIEKTFSWDRAAELVKEAHGW